VRTRVVEAGGAVLWPTPKDSILKRRAASDRTARSILSACQVVGLKSGTLAGSMSKASYRHRAFNLGPLAFFEPEQLVQSVAIKIAKTTFRATISSQLIRAQY
jgi:hypothetical protein